ncbi:hypothetical protein SUGI_0698620 [Cryptomeria japonica]|uniref:wall-associated receptor kinase 2 n=1 Tax=Cryptomeria japonica TaxID=3369 RepID=UPI002414C983|nr:wall-associated receptor kinase 2 [Cryptomeria japonica]GLJ34716.1 hypothetical protein SUGI_0698620 [Cryptomeria japonica]
MACGKKKSSTLQTPWQVGCVLIIWLYSAASAVSQCNIQFCGSQNVSYPFWIDNPSCGYPGFQISCREKDNGNSSGLFLEAGVNGTQTEFEILNIDYTGSLIINSTSLKAMSCSGNDDASVLFELPADGPFTIASNNKFVVIGCRSKGSFRVYNGNYNNEVDGGEVICRTTTCLNQYDPEYCNTYGCCESGIPGKQRVINFTGGGISYAAYTACGFSTILDPVTWSLPPNQYGAIGGGHYGLRLEWGIGHGDCLTAKGTANYSCAGTAQCSNAIGGGHVCKCLTGYEGTGYSNGTGCTDVDECNRHLDQCVEPSQGGVCYNLPGSYNCSCAKDYSGDGLQNGTRCQSSDSNQFAAPAIIGSVSSVAVVCVAASLLVWWLKKRHLKLVEAKYYQKLQQHLASRGGRESLRMFSADELAKASNNYSKEMVLGSGGFGIVFKGILSDGTLVAIKKSKQALDLEDDHEFLNEIAILSQINHRNIVKLLGCCIQTKFPMLVSEFVPNGTLYEHLQFKEISLPWESRLQIAIETGEALAYLHSGASQPIFHRDVKSSNILLDKTFSPKVADFGISRLISTSNNTHHTTNIMGTKGYLDPEYFQTYQLTDKSDVFSFGVVLIELLTGLKPLSVERISEEWNLSTLFLARLNHNRLREILDSGALEDENLQQMEDVARLAKVCLHLERRKRPSMKEVVEELVWIRGGTRKTKFHESDYATFEQTSISQKASQTSTEFRSYDFPSTVGRTSEEPFTALIQMSSLL